MEDHVIEDASLLRKIAGCEKGYLFSAVYHPWEKKVPTEKTMCIDTESLDEATRRGQEVLAEIREQGAVRGCFLVTPTGEFIPFDDF